MTAAPQSTRDAMQAGADALFGLINAIDGAGYSTEFQRNLSRAASALSLLRAALEAREPAGWKLVPMEPTEEMHAAAVRTIVRCSGNHDFPPRVWRAMLAASPVAAPVEARPVAWLVTFPNEPELGHYLTEERPDSSLGVTPLYASPVAADDARSGWRITDPAHAKPYLTDRLEDAAEARAAGWRVETLTVEEQPSSVSPLGPGEDEYLSWVKELERGCVAGECGKTAGVQLNREAR